MLGWACVLTLSAASNLSFVSASPLDGWWTPTTADDVTESLHETFSVLSWSSESAPSAPVMPALEPVRIELPPPPDAPHAGFNAPTSTTWLEVKALRTKSHVVLVDARERPAFEAGHIPGAICLPPSVSTLDLESFRTQHGIHALVVVYCASTGCSVSFQLAHLLAREYGFSQVQYMSGGYSEYQRDMALAAGDLAPPASSPDPADSGSLVIPEGNSQHNPQPISWIRVEEWVASQTALLVDVRSRAAFIRGHVPGAISLPSTRVAEDLMSFRMQVGADQTVILYGEMAGSMSAFSTGRRLMRDSGFRSVRFVVEGYREWATNHASLPSN